MNSQQQRRKRFIEEYPIDRNATQAALRAGYSPRSAYSQGSRLLRDAVIRAAIDERTAAVSEATQITAQAVLERWWQLATADAGELTQFRRMACRHCHGASYAYHWIDEPEWMAALVEAEGRGDYAPITCEGGFGYRRNEDPNPDCPKCEGEGVGELWAADTRNLTDAGRALFDGVKKTKDGFEIKQRDRDHALLQVAKHLGMFTETVDHKSSDGSMAPDRPLTHEELIEEAKRRGLPTELFKR